MSKYTTTQSDTQSDTASENKDCFQPVRRLYDKFATPSSRSKMTQSTTSSKTPMSLRQARTVPRSVHKMTNFTTKAQLAMDPIQVYCRLKPNDQPISCVVPIDDVSVELRQPEADVKQGNTLKVKTFGFKRVFTESSQKEIFEEVGLPLINDLLQGKNGLLLAYGNTGSGKTYTMSGPNNDIGMTPRCLDVIFNSIKNRMGLRGQFKPDKMNGFEVLSKADAMFERQKEIHKIGRPRTATESKENMRRERETTELDINNEYVYAVFVQYVEVYNNYVYDLLDEEGDGRRNNAFLREDQKTRNVYVVSATEVEVESANEAYDVYLRGKKKKKMAHTALNSESSRSHSIFTIRIVQAPIDDSDEVIERGIMISQLSLVDLAGSERYGRTGAVGDRLKEAGKINNSLMHLRNCLEILRKNQRSGTNDIVQYRTFKLTFFLKNFFEGEGLCRVILCVNPRVEEYDENQHVLMFAVTLNEVEITRPQEKRIEAFATPGVKRRNQIHKPESKRRLIEKNETDEEFEFTASQMAFGLEPPLPFAKLNGPHDDMLILNLKKALQMRIEGRAQLQKICQEKKAAFIDELTRTDRVLETLRNENIQLRYQMEQEKDRKESAEQVAKTLQFEKSEIEIKAEEQQNLIEELNQQIETYRMELVQAEKSQYKLADNVKSNYEMRLELEEKRKKEEMAKNEAKIRKSYKEKEKTLEAVRQLVIEGNGGRRGKKKSLVRASSEESVLSTSREDFRKITGRVASEPKLPDGNGFEEKLRFFKNPRMKIINKGDKWVDHRVGQVLKTHQTVFQPYQKKKKSVSALVKVDDLGDANKYSSRLQDVDSEQELVDKLITGSIYNTETGGKQVVFETCEVLKTLSPTAPAAMYRSPIKTRSSRKRINDESRHEDENISQKCSVALTHASSKRSKN